MSQRGKRHSRLENDEPPPTKKRKGRPPANKSNSYNIGNGSSTHLNSNESGSQNGGSTMSPSTTSSTWQARSLSDLKLSSIYNRSAPEPPAELFRKDLISAMKLPDSEPLAPDEYWVITDQWKQEWERGVQVPVSPDSLPEPTVLAKQQETFYTGRQDFKLPKSKFIRITKDENFSSDLHYLSNTPAMAKASCSYDLDPVDEAWLNILNGERTMVGHLAVTEEQFERVIEELEIVCWDKIQAIIKTEEGLGIEYDENVICDVCRSPDSEEANEMVFCDSCNICVHQACYGITTIPSGQWLCRTCSMGQRPDCVLCPNKGGAMKSARSGQKWAHVSCALWIPEVSIGSVDRMEPITKISSIPQSRWALICVLCRERVGACIQCSVKPCKTAYHVTCAFQHGLEMRAIIEDENAEDGVKLKSYCLKHSVNKNNSKKKERSLAHTGAKAGAAGSGTEDDDTNKRKKRKDMTTEERNMARAKRLQEIETEFDKHVSIKDINCTVLEVDQEAINYVYNYWILKRKAANNRPLLPPKSEDADMIAQKQEQADNEKMKMFVHLRQDLERVRNLCYMVSRREKLSRSFFKLREQTFHRQMSVLSELNKNTDSSLLTAVLDANHGPTMYDKLYSSEEIGANMPMSLDDMISALNGSLSMKTLPAIVSNNNKPQSESNQKRAQKATNLNGLKKNALKNQNADNQLNRLYLNGTNKPSSKVYYSSISSSSECEQRLRSSSEEDNNRSTRRNNISPNKKTTSKTPNSKTADKKKRRQALRKQKSLESSSEDDEDDRRIRKTRVSKDVASNTDSEGHSQMSEKQSPKSRLLRQMERELAKEKLSGTESDELVPIVNSAGLTGTNSNFSKLSASIYSDSDDSTDKEKTDNTASDSQNHTFRTKAALKEFNSHQNAAVKSVCRNSKGNSSIEADERVKTNARLEPEQEQSNQKGRKDKVQKESPSKLSKLNDKAREKQEKERIQREKAEKERLAKIEEERTEKEAAEKERIDRLQHEKLMKSKDKKKKKEASKDFPTDLQVVPQRQAAKKASEIMMRTQVVGSSKKEQQRDDDKKELPKEINKPTKDRQDSKDSVVIKETANKQKGRVAVKVETKTEPLEDKEKDTKSKKNVKIDKNIMVAYVPQRQAAKKAAEHIKGLGKVTTPSDATNAVVADEKPEKTPVTPPNTKSLSSTNALTKPIIPASPKLSSSSSSCSSSSSSSDSSGSSSSSSDSDDDSEADKKSSSFLNKDSKTSSSISSDESSSSDSDSSESSSDDEANHSVVKNAPVNSPAKSKSNITSSKGKVANDKKSISAEPVSVSVKKEKPAKASSSKAVGRTSKSIPNDRRQSADVRSGAVAKGATVKSTNASSKNNSSSKSKLHEDKKEKTSIKHNAEKPPAPIPARTTAGRKRKSNTLDDKPNETKVREPKDDTKSVASSGNDESPSRHQARGVTKTKSPGEASGPAADEESCKPSKLPVAQRETNARLESHSVESPSKVQSLEQEINDRKAESQVPTANNASKSKLSDALDKLFYKQKEKEEQQKKDTVHTKRTPHNVESNRNSVDMEIEPKESSDVVIAKEKHSSQIHVDSQNQSVANEALIKSDPVDDSDDQLLNINKYEQEQFVNNMPKPPTPKSSIIFSAPSTSLTNDKREASIFDFADSLIAIPTDSAAVSLLSFNSDNLFKEDSAKETMDLVANLRQNIKKGGKAEDCKAKQPTTESTNQAQDKETEIPSTDSLMIADNIKTNATDMLLPSGHPTSDKAKCLMSKPTLIIDLDQENSGDGCKSSQPITMKIVKPTTAKHAAQNDKNWIQQNALCANDATIMGMPQIPSTPQLQTEVEQIASKMSSDIPINVDMLAANDLNEAQNIKPFSHVQPYACKAFNGNKESYDRSLVIHHEKEQALQQNMRSDQVTIRHRSDLIGDIDDNEGYVLNKWSEQEMIQTRRSVSSSPSSESENNEIQEDSRQHHHHHQKVPSFTATKVPPITISQSMSASNQIPSQNSITLRPTEVVLNENKEEVLPFGASQPQSMAGQMNQFNYTNENGAVSLFPPISAASFPQSTGAPSAIYPSTFTNAYQSISTSNVVQQITNQSDANSTINYSANLCATSAFTSSSSTRSLAMSNSMSASQLDTTPMMPSNNNLPQIPPHANANNNNNEICSSKHDFNRRMLSPRISPQPIQETVQFPKHTNYNSTQAEPIHLQPHSSQPDRSYNLDGTLNSLASSTLEKQQPDTIPEVSAKRPTRYNVQSMQKSPSKSPGKSPRQMETLRQKSESARGGRSRGARNASGAGGRGAANRVPAASRGRGRNRPQHVVPLTITNTLFDLNNAMSAGTIHNKLQGTVYDLDFDEDLNCGDNVENLKTMRERRRSIEFRHQSDYLRSGDASSESPKFSSTATSGQKTSDKSIAVPPAWRTDARDIMPPSPHDLNAAIPLQSNSAAATAVQPMNNQSMEPVMPGPVDMRTYGCGPVDSNTNDMYNSNNTLGFASNLPGNTIPDLLDEELEKNFQSTLKSSTATKLAVNTMARDDADERELELMRSQNTAMRFIPHIIDPTTINDPTAVSLDHHHHHHHHHHHLEQTPEPPRHSLIKLKIKGPHARPENYTSSVITTYQTHNNATIEQTIQGTPNSSIRRMRKKELLRQYWTQENMDDSNCAPQQEQAQNSTAANSANSGGRSAGIPKAVDSMSSIPTKDDYKDYATLDIKKRKAPANRELRQLDIPMYDDMPERRRSVCSNTSNTSSSNAGGESSKRKTRTKQSTAMTTPKLKIKLGPDVFEPSGAGDISGGGGSGGGSARPPKKRLSNITIPSFEELRRDSMNFRKQVISQFNDTAKPKKKDKSKREKGKHKKKKEKDKEKDKEKKANRVEIVSSNDTNPSKLIIRFAKRKVAETTVTNDSGDEVSNASHPIETTAAPAAPIRLKLARSSQGGGYVMAEPIASTSTNSASNGSIPKNSTDIARCQVVLTDFTKLNEAEKYACNLQLQSTSLPPDQPLNGNSLIHLKDTSSADIGKNRPINQNSETTPSNEQDSNVPILALNCEGKNVMSTTRS